MPLPGGLFDQDSLFVHLYEHVGQCRKVRQDMDESKQQANAKLPAARRH